MMDLKLLLMKSNWYSKIGTLYEESRIFVDSAQFSYPTENDLKYKIF